MMNSKFRKGVPLESGGESDRGGGPEPLADS